MKINEAIENLINIKNEYFANYGEESMINIPIDEFDIQAIDMAIQVLEQEPCEDAISRQAVMDCFKKWQPYMATRLWDFEQELSKLPPVKPQEPKTVLYSGDGYADGHMVYDMAECPNCGYEYDYGDKDWGLSFCPNCGQKLNWERSDKE